MSIRRTHLAVLASAAAAIALPAAALAGAAGGAHSARTFDVVLKNLRFHPATLSIHRGDSVTWLWRDEGVSHNVTASSFRSRTQDTGSFTVRFSHVGTFSYRCTIHAAVGMRGKIVVH